MTPDGGRFHGLIEYCGVVSRAILFDVHYDEADRVLRALLLASSNHVGCDCLSHNTDSKLSLQDGYGDAHNADEQRAAIYSPGWLALPNQRLAGDCMD